jgi:hypothetical protein
MPDPESDREHRNVGATDARPLPEPAPVPVHRARPAPLVRRLSADQPCTTPGCRGTDVAAHHIIAGPAGVTIAGQRYADGDWVDLCAKDREKLQRDRQID